jgi:hypothetical protein
MSNRWRAIMAAGGLALVVLSIVAAVHTGGAERPGNERPAASPGAAGNAANRPAPTPRTPPAAAAPKEEKPAPRYQDVLIEGVPHVRQKPDFCGEACAAMFLQKLGRPVDQDYVFDRSGLDPMEARGCYTKELAAALRDIGFEIGPVWHKVEVAKQAAGVESQWRAVHADLAAGVPSIVCTHYDDAPRNSEHFRLILGYDSKSDEVIYHEPAEDGGANHRMKREKLLRLWPLEYDAKTWTVIRIALKPGPRVYEAAYPVSAAGTHTPADYAQHLMQLKPKVPEGFTAVLERPFFVIGDESPTMVRRRAVGTVKWAVDKLKKAYFAKDPADVLDIWLFKDKASYEKHTQAIFNYKPNTPFGYFSQRDKALVMNIATGGGTLVHEIVHPFVASNFPECPAWLNEGLGSLYEQSSERDGKIVGLTNWRLAGLQKAIREERVPAFAKLCGTSQHQFYNEDPGTNYGQARYLCYYLQEQDLLRKFYHRFHANWEKDPSGYKTLREVLGRRDMDRFQKDWEAWVLKLRFP